MTKAKVRDAVNPFDPETLAGENDDARPVEALTTQAGGDFFAPKTGRSNPAETPRPRPKDQPVDRISSSIYNMRLTEVMHDELRLLKRKTGITVQAHVRRAILDYLYEMRTEHPNYFE